MASPWGKERHATWWASNTFLTLILLIVLIAATALSDHFGEPPNYLVGLLGTAAGAFFAAIGSDKQKKEAVTQATAERAEAKVDQLAQDTDHPSVVNMPTPPKTPGGEAGP